MVIQFSPVVNTYTYISLPCEKNLNKYYAYLVDAIHQYMVMCIHIKQTFIHRYLDVYSYSS